MPGPVPSSTSRALSLNDVIAAGGSTNLDETIPTEGARPRAPTSEPDAPALERVAQAGRRALGVGKEAAKIAASHKVIHLMKDSGIPLVVGAGKVAGHLHVAHLAYEAAHLAIGPGTLREDQKAAVRQSYDLTAARLASNVLPPSYLAARVAPQEVTTSAVLTGMTRTLERKLGSAEKAEEAMRGFQAEAERGATAGMKHAGSHGLRSEAARDTLLAKDRGFRERYNGDLTFRAGVDAMVWLGANQPAEFEQRRASLSGQAARVAGAR